MQHFRHSLGTVSSSSAGFGNRFGKPKGPRSYPETWVWGSRPQLIARRFGTAGSSSQASLKLILILWKIQHRRSERDWRPCVTIRQHPWQRTGSVTLHHMDRHSHDSHGGGKKTSSHIQKWEVWHFLLKCSWQPFAIHIAVSEAELWL